MILQQSLARSAGPSSRRHDSESGGGVLHRHSSDGRRKHGSPGILRLSTTSSAVRTSTLAEHRRDDAEAEGGCRRTSRHAGCHASRSQKLRRERGRESEKDRRAHLVGPADDVPEHRPLRDRRRSAGRDGSRSSSSNYSSRWSLVISRRSSVAGQSHGFLLQHVRKTMPSKSGGAARPRGAHAGARAALRQPPHASTPRRFPTGCSSAIFGMGCFWGAEKNVLAIAEGVYTTAVGYAAGHTPNPTYREVCSGMTGHAEVVLVVFDPKVTSYDEMLKVFLGESRSDAGHAAGQRRRQRSAAPGICTTSTTRRRRRRRSSRDAFQKSAGGALRCRSPPRSCRRRSSTMRRITISSTPREELERLLRARRHGRENLPNRRQCLTTSRTTFYPPRSLRAERRAFSAIVGCPPRFNLRRDPAANRFAYVAGIVAAGAPVPCRRRVRGAWRRQDDAGAPPALRG